MVSTSENQTSSNRGKRTVWLLSAIAFSPLVILAAMLVNVQNSNTIFLPLLDMFKTVSAIILSFLGGIRWGIALRDQPSKSWILAAALLPAIVGWLSLLLSGPAAIGGLLIAVCGMGAWDSFYWSQRTDEKWYGKVRITMTLLAAFAHCAVLLAML